MGTDTQGLAYITETSLEIIEYLNEEPLDATLKDYLMAEFGEHGQRREVAKDQEEERSRCNNDDPYCCGYCTGYRIGTLLEEIADVVQGYCTKTIDISCDPRSYGYRVVEDSSLIPF